jgi:hypothetical protein
MPTYIVYYTQGNTPGPFDIYLSGSSGLNLYASNIAQWQLVNGYQVTFPDGIPSSSVDIFDTSYGCFVDQNVPFPTPSPTVTPTISITPSVTPTISFTPTVTPTRTVTPTVTPSFTPPPTQTPTITLTPSISATPFNSPTPTRTPTVTRTPSATAPPNYLALGITSPGGSLPYQACYQFNINGYAGGWVYAELPSGTVPMTLSIGTRLYTTGAGGYVPFVGYNLWYGIGDWLFTILTTTAYQVDNDGYIVDTGSCSIVIP